MWSQFPAFLQHLTILYILQKTSLQLKGYMTPDFLTQNFQSLLTILNCMFRFCFRKFNIEHIVSLKMWHQIFLEFWLVYTWFFAHPPDQRVSKIYASWMKGEAKSCFQLSHRQPPKLCAKIVANNVFNGFKGAIMEFQWSYFWQTYVFVFRLK